jgi:colicin import membrane protein
MLKEILKHPGALLIAITVHLLIVIVFIISFSWTEPPAGQETGIPIELIQEIPLARIQPKKTTPPAAEVKTIKDTREQNTDKPVVDNIAKMLVPKKSAKLLAQQKTKLEAEPKKKELEKRKKEKAAKEKAAKEYAEKKAKEKAAKEKAAKEYAEKEAKEKAARKYAEKKAKEKAAREYAIKKAREKAAKEKAAREYAAKKAREKAEAKKRLKKEKIAAAKAKKEARDKKIRDAALKRWNEKKRLEKEKRLAAARKAKEEAEKKKQAAILAKKKALEAKLATAKAYASKKAKLKAKTNWGNNIIRHVKRHWQLPPGTQGMSAKVRIKVSPSGYIRGAIEMVYCGGDATYCASVIQAYKNSEPLPRPSRNDLDRTFLITMDDK